MFASGRKQLELKARFRTIPIVLKPGAILTSLLVVLAGCSTGPRRSANSAVPGWTAAAGRILSPKEAENVPPEPRIAPPSARLSRPAAPAISSRANPWISLSRWSRRNGLGPVRETARVPRPTYAVTTSRGSFVVHLGSRVASWEGVEVLLGFAPRLINGQPCVRLLDLEKNLIPLMHGFVLPTERHPVIVIDPGHGGHNTGTHSVLTGVDEKVFTLDWARRLAPLLAAEGWKVYLTRTTDTDMSLSDRVAFATKHHADLFISLHFNSAAPSREQSGLETYCLTPQGMPSTLTRGYPDDISRVFPNNAFDRRNVELAFRMQQALLGVVGKDRGVRRARFLGVLRGQECPAILIEGGFLSNPREARLIAQPAYQERLAQALAQGLAFRPRGWTAAGGG